MAGTVIAGTVADYWVRNFRDGVEQLQSYNTEDTYHYVGGRCTTSSNFDLYRSWVMFDTQVPTHCRLEGVSLYFYCDVFAVDTGMTVDPNLAFSLGTAAAALSPIGLLTPWNKNPGWIDAGTLAYSSIGWYSLPFDLAGTLVNRDGHTFFRMSRPKETTSNTTGRWAIVSCDGAIQRPYLGGTAIWAKGAADMDPAAGHGIPVVIPALGAIDRAPGGVGAPVDSGRPAGVVSGIPSPFWR